MQTPKLTIFTTLTTAALMTVTSWGAIAQTTPSTTSQLENLRQLLASRECMQCDLRGAGLIVANLSRVNLAGANLSRANLSRANLDGADLRGADLRGANLNGANLSGAILTGAQVDGADLRSAIFFSADLRGVNLQTAFIQGALGIPNYAGSPDNFYAWGVGEAGRGNYRGAIDFYNQALDLNGDYAPAYLGRAVSRYRLGDVRGAVQDANIAQTLFTRENSADGIAASEMFIKGMEAAANPGGGGEGNFLSFLGTIGSALIQLLF